MKAYTKPLVTVIEASCTSMLAQSIEKGSGSTSFGGDNRTNIDREFEESIW